MKKNKIMAMCSIILAVIFLCGGCAAVLQSLESPELRQSTEAMLDALIAGDSQTAYSLVSNICTEEDFKVTFAQMRDLLRGADTYELKLLSIYSNSAIINGQKINSVSSVYEMTVQNKKLIVSVRMDDQIGLNGFYLTPYEYTDYYFTGTLEAMEDATWAQWVVLLMNVIILGFVVFALVDCCRHKIRMKALWIILLILGFVSVGVSISSTGFRLNYNVGWIMAYSALIRYGSGTITFRLMLPVGAIVYFIKRHSLLQQNTPVAAPSKEPQIPEEENGPEQQSCQLPIDDQTADTD